MRLLAGVLCFAILAFGVLIGIVYPLTAASQQGYELARWQALYETGDGDGFRSFETILPSSEERVLVRVELTTPDQAADLDRSSVLTVTAVRSGRIQFAASLSLDDVPRAPAGDPAGSGVYVFDAGTLYFIDDEPFSFDFEPGYAEIRLTSVELVLIGGTQDYDESVPPIGYGLMAAGALGMFLARRRRGPKGPPPPRWGRG